MNHIIVKLIMNNRRMNTLLYAESVYSLFEIEKKNKDNRKIYEPNRDLKKVLTEIKEKIEKDFDDEIKRMKYQHAYTKGKNIVSNAEPHVKKKYVLKLDIENYFDSITFARVYGKLKKKYDNSTACKIAQLTCYRVNGKHIALAQGSPLSPILSNIISQSIDIYFYKKLNLKNKKISYTRYSDDITISTDDEDIFNKIKKLYYEDFQKITGFKLNEKKTKIIEDGSRKVVTGIIINEKLNVSRSYKKDLRNYLRNAKWDIGKTIKNYSEKNNIEIDKNQFEKIMKGKIDFIKQVKGQDSTYFNFCDLFNNVPDFSYKFDKRNLQKKTIISILFGNNDSPSHGTGFITELNDERGLLSNFHVWEYFINELENDSSFYNLDFFYHDKLENDQYLFGYDETLKLRTFIVTNIIKDKIYYDEELDYCFIPITVLRDILKINIKIKNILEIEETIEENSELSIVGYPQSFDNYATNTGKIKKKNYPIYTTNFAVGKGASGSPVMQNGKVVGLYFGEETNIQPEEDTKYPLGAMFIDIKKVIKDIEDKDKLKNQSQD